MVLRTGGASPEPVSALVAGSLQRAFENLAEQVGPRVRIEAHGSVAAARLVGDDQRDPDVLALADTDLFTTPVDAAWHARVATNALVVAYDAESEGGRRVATAERWFDPVREGTARFGRTDPDLDPLGYRTLFALDLAASYYDEPGLPEAVLGPDQIYPETSLVGRFETGGVDAALVYRSMAVERGYPYRDLPAAVDLSDPARDDHYATARYTLPSGATVRGDHVAYGVQARSDDAATRTVVRALLDGVGLSTAGFGRPDAYPVFQGAVPRGYR